MSEKQGREMEPKSAAESVKQGCQEKETLDIDKVHSANSWESADLGDDDRRKKFLKLMGADKKKHHGRFVIGDQESSHGRSRNETEKISKSLEDQFHQGMEHKLSGGFKSHTGLGFSEPDEKNSTTEVKDSTAEAKDSTTEAKDSTTETKDSTTEAKDSTTEEKKESEPVENKTAEKVKESSQKHKLDEDNSNGQQRTKVMKFVKASS